MVIKQALIMAAGEAKRMRPLTDNLPKPLIEVNSQPLLTHSIRHLSDAGVTRIVINGYHAIEKLEAYIAKIAADYPAIEFILSKEIELLETGGGAVQALQYLDIDQPFYMINGDAFWQNPNNSNSLIKLSDAWHKLGNKARLLLLVQPIETLMIGCAVGDYNLINSLAQRAKNRDGAAMFTGIRVCHPAILQKYKSTCFSFLKIMDEMEAQGALHVQIHEGQWYHLSTPQDVEAVNALLIEKAA
jgi:MurNAc alpha-1-phosphate uridylyltransferase